MKFKPKLVELVQEVGSFAIDSFVCELDKFVDEHIQLKQNLIRLKLITAQSVANLNVIVHPLVLLSVVDHYNRVAKDTKKRVVGVLLGSRNRTSIDITNSFAVPFEEDLNNPNV